ncbi:MAG TPA: nuclear transport factor 2 family protein [Luteimonas sp.]
MPDSGRNRRAWDRAALLVLLLLAAAGCTRTPPEEALRDTVREALVTIESREAGALADHLAEDFVGPGGLDRDGARRLAALHFLRHGDVGVLPGPLDVELQEGHARVRFSAVLAGGSGRLLPDSTQAWQVDTGWRLDDGEWRMTSADWAPALR